MVDAGLIFCSVSVVGGKLDLLERFPHLRVLWKAIITFGTVLGAWALLAEFSAPLDEAQQWMYSQVLALPALFAGFFAVYMVIECIHRSQRLAMESRRTDPMVNRRPPQRESKRRRRRRRRRQNSRN
jgi:hypothetical protein